LIDTFWEDAPHLPRQLRQALDAGDAHTVRLADLVPDAHLATVLRQHGVRTLYTSDRDFLKFRFLDVRDPFERRP